MGEDGSAIHNFPTAPLAQVAGGATIGSSGHSTRTGPNAGICAILRTATHSGCRLVTPPPTGSATQRKEWQAGRGLLARQQTSHLWTRGCGPSQPLLTHPGLRSEGPAGRRAGAASAHHPPPTTPMLRATAGAERPPQGPSCRHAPHTRHREDPAGKQSPDPDLPGSPPPRTQGSPAGRG